MLQLSSLNGTIALHSNDKLIFRVFENVLFEKFPDFFQILREFAKRKGTNYHGEATIV